MSLIIPPKNLQNSDNENHMCVSGNGKQSITLTLKVQKLADIQGGPAKVKPLTFSLVTFECIAKIQ